MKTASALLELALRSVEVRSTLASLADVCLADAREAEAARDLRSAALSELIAYDLLDALESIQEREHQL
jgi:hypothetical protein